MARINTLFNPLAIAKNVIPLKIDNIKTKNNPLAKNFSMTDIIKTLSITC